MSIIEQIRGLRYIYDTETQAAHLLAYILHTGNIRLQFVLQASRNYVGS